MAVYVLVHGDRAWRFHEFACGHVIQREAPRELAEVLLALV